MPRDLQLSRSPRSPQSHLTAGRKRTLQGNVSQHTHACMQACTSGCHAKRPTRENSEPLGDPKRPSTCLPGPGTARHRGTTLDRTSTATTLSSKRIIGGTGSPASSVAPTAAGKLTVKQASPVVATASQQSAPTRAVPKATAAAATATTPSATAAAAAGRHVGSSTIGKRDTKRGTVASQQSAPAVACITPTPTAAAAIGSTKSAGNASERVVKHPVGPAGRSCPEVSPSARRSLRPA